MESVHQKATSGLPKGGEESADFRTAGLRLECEIVVVNAPCTHCGYDEAR